MIIRISSEPATVQIMIDQEHIKYSGSMITNAARCTRETKSMIVMAKGEFSYKKTLFTGKLDLRRKRLKCYTWSSTEIFGRVCGLAACQTTQWMNESSGVWNISCACWDLNSSSCSLFASPYSNRAATAVIQLVSHVSVTSPALYSPRGDMTVEISGAKSKLKTFIWTFFYFSVSL